MSNITVLNSLSLECVCVCVCARAQLCPTLCSPIDCSLPGSSIDGIGHHFLLQGIFWTEGSKCHVS